METGQPEHTGTAELTMALAVNRMIGRPPRKVMWFWESRESFLTDCGILLFGSSGAFSVGLIGSLPVNELLLFPLLPLALLSKGRRAFRPEYVWFYILTGGWLLGTIVADSYFSSPLQSRLKGTARVVFFVLNFIALAILINNRPRRMVMFAISIAVVMLFYGMAFWGGFSLMWKFGLSGAVAIAALLISSYYYSQRRYWISTFISVALGAINLYYGFRSQLVVHLISGMLILPLFGRKQAFRSGVRRGRGAFGVIMLLVFAGGAAYVANLAIKYAAELGIFDESLSQKFEGQAKGDYGVLFGGRPETLVAIQAIRDNPILGHGSYPVDQKYMELKQDIQYEHGYSDSDTPDDLEDPVIPTHSHLTMAWVESGILGGLCWIYLLFLTFRAILELGNLRHPLSPVYGYLLVWFMWDILYSPFGSVNRIWAAYFILLSYHILHSTKARGVSAHPQSRRLYRNRKNLLPRGAL
jgi:O-antigen ligase